MDAQPQPDTVTILALPTLGLVEAGDDLGHALVAALDHWGGELRDGDVVAVASKVVALAEGAVIEADPRTDDVDGDDPRRALARSQADRIVADAPRALVVATRHGFVCANAGIDASNVADGLLLLPVDPDASAAALRAHVAAVLGVDVAVVITDTFGRPWRMGQVDVALGIAGMAALRDERGTRDLHGRHLDVTVAAVGDAVAAAADLVRTKSSGMPFVLLRGLEAGGTGTGRDLVRPLDEDLFPAGGPTLFDHAVTARPERPHSLTAKGLVAVLGSVADTVAAAHGDVTITVVTEPRPAMNVTAPTELGAGMAVEAVRIALAGRGIAIDRPHVIDHPRGGGRTRPGRSVTVLARPAMASPAP